MIFYDILLLNLDDYKMFREAAFFELENLMRSEIKIDSKREALDIMYQPHENEIYGDDDDNYFLYLDDKSGYLFPITLVGSTTNSNNNSSSNLNLQCEKLNASIINNLNGSDTNNIHNKDKIDNINIDSKSNNINNDINNYNLNSNKKNKIHESIDLFGKIIPPKGQDIFKRKTSAAAVVLNIQGFDQISKSEVKKRDDDKIKEKEKDLSYQDQLRVHPLATICGQKQAEEEKEEERRRINQRINRLLFSFLIC